MANLYVNGRLVSRSVSFDFNPEGGGRVMAEYPKVPSGKQTKRRSCEPVFSTQDLSDRHTDDKELREKGFRIHSRPNRGEPLWVRGGRVFTQAEAVKIVRANVGGET